jgi:hypothetical protein
MLCLLGLLGPLPRVTALASTRAKPCASATGACCAGAGASGGARRRSRCAAPDSKGRALAWKTPLALLSLLSLLG